jgi:hypothetical protein
MKSFSANRRIRLIAFSLPATQRKAKQDALLSIKDLALLAPEEEAADLLT